MVLALLAADGEGLVACRALTDRMLAAWPAAALALAETGPLAETGASPDRVDLVAARVAAGAFLGAAVALGEVFMFAFVFAAVAGSLDLPGCEAPVFMLAAVLAGLSAGRLAAPGFATALEPRAATAGAGDLSALRFAGLGGEGVAFFADDFAAGFWEARLALSPALSEAAEDVCLAVGLGLLFAAELAGLAAAADFEFWLRSAAIRSSFFIPRQSTMPELLANSARSRRERELKSAGVITAGSWYCCQA